MSTKTTNDILPGNVLGKANELLTGLNKEQIAWLGGYLSAVGLNNSTQETVATTETTTQRAETIQSVPEAANIKILVGSHSGNSKKVASVIARLVADNKGEAEIVNMADYKPRQINKEENLLIIVSTHGEGEPPVAAEDLHKFLGSKRVGDLSKVNFAVIALGDSSYKYYCKTGVDFHDRLKSNGANALAEPVLLDTNFSDYLISVAQETYKLFKPKSGDSTTTEEPTSTGVPTNTIFEAEILEKIQLNGKGSKKETYHIELSLEGSGFKYEPGDALEVFPINESKLVQSIITKLGFNIRKIVNIKDENVTLLQALSHQREITVITVPAFKNLVEFTDNKEAKKLAEDLDKATDFLEGIDLLDLIEKYKLTLTPQQLVDALRPLPPRAYSISSSQSEVDEEVHLTIAPVRYDKNDRQHNGVASTYFADRLKVGEGVAVRVKQNEGFRLPEENKPIIMIGPGTGVAPFRAFLQERSENEHSGKNWLFFGDQHFETDFLYQAEWLKYRSKGLLNNIDVAFSRDQKEKIYVQHRIKEKGSEIYKWIEDGSYIYICGDKKNMANDVKNTLIEVIQTEGKLNQKQAEDKFNQLRKQNRYQEDVY